MIRRITVTVLSLMYLIITVSFVSCSSNNTEYAQKAVNRLCEVFGENNAVSKIKVMVNNNKETYSLSKEDNSVSFNDIIARVYVELEHGDIFHEAVFFIDESGNVDYYFKPTDEFIEYMVVQKYPNSDQLKALSGVASGIYRERNEAFIPDSTELESWKTVDIKDIDFSHINKSDN